LILEYVKDMMYLMNMLEYYITNDIGITTNAAIEAVLENTSEMNA